MQFAKLVDGEPELAAMPITVDGRMVWTTDPRPYGYKELILAPVPVAPDGYVAEYDGWDETVNQIKRRWKFVPAPPVEPTDTEVIADAVAELSEVVSDGRQDVSDLSDALAELSEVASDLTETETVNADAIAELSALVSEIINGRSE